MTHKPTDFGVRGGEVFLIMESPTPPGNPSNSTLFTAAESESVIKYLVGFTSIFSLESFVIKMPRWDTVSGRTLLEYWYHSPQAPWWVLVNNAFKDLWIKSSLNSISQQTSTGAGYIARHNNNQNDVCGRELPSEGLHELRCGGCNGRIYGPFSGDYHKKCSVFSSTLCWIDAWSAEYKCDKDTEDRPLTSAFQSSIAPHHTTHQMTTKETLLDMRRKLFSFTRPIIVNIICIIFILWNIYMMHWFEQVQLWAALGVLPWLDLWSLALSASLRLTGAEKK